MRLLQRLWRIEKTMLLINCVYCGLRPEVEFRCGGEAHIARPTAPDQLSDEDWTSYLYVRSNPKGLRAERWSHVHGCGRWFNAIRDTVTDRIAATYSMDAEAPIPLEFSQ